MILPPSLVSDKPPVRAPDRTADETAAAVRALEPRLRQIMRERKVPGMGLVVVKDDKVVLLQGFGYRNVEKRLPFTADTIAHIASTSKAFCGTTLVMAANDGLLRLDESPKRLLPDFRMKDPEADRGMTIADLMCHSSGLPRTDAGWFPGKIDAKEATRLLGEGEPTYPFRYVGQYSNMMVETAGRAVAAAYGKPWPEVLREKVTGPLGMASTKPYKDPSDEPDRASVGYFTAPDGTAKPDVTSTFRAIAAAGGLQSTARDLGTWLRFHLNDGEVDGKRLLPAKWVEEAHRGRFDFVGDIRYGLGWFSTSLRPDEVVYHGGDLPGFQTDVVLVPSRRLGFAILTNNDSAGARGPLEGLLLDRLVGKLDRRGIERAAKAAGLYGTADGSRWLRLDPARTDLMTVSSEGRPIRLRARGEQEWIATDPHDPKIVVSVVEDVRAKGRKLVRWTQDGATTEYAYRARDYRPDTTPKALARRVAEATGLAAARAGKTLECRYTARYASDAVDAVGLLYRAPVGRMATFESEWVGPLRNTYAHSAFLPDQVASSDESYRDDVSPSDPRLGSMAGYCNESAGLPKDAKTEIVGETEFRGERAYLVRTTWPGGLYRLDTISKTRALPLRREIPGVRTEVYNDYRTVDGIAVPMRLTIVDDNLATTRLVVTSARTVDGDPHWAWSPTAWPKRP